MKVALLITTYNRPKYLQKCLWSVSRADLSRIDTIVVADDASTNKETNQLISDFCYDTLAFASHNRENIGIQQTLLANYEKLFKSHDIVINIDGDAIVRPDFANKLLDSYFCGLLTGFHSTTKNANGTERHKILYEESNLLVKQSVGGINFCVNRQAYENYLKPALQKPGNFDHNACITAGYAYCLKESVVQHIGFDSSLGHTEQPDVADDFYYWNLPDVTLFGVDINQHRLQKAADICTEWIKFGDVIMLNPELHSKETYSKFIIEETYKHIRTTHILIFQHDGYVNNFMAWDNDWLQYDYIGAPWYYDDGMAVGNGGFSLRSKRLMKILATDKHIQIHHPEDHHICRTYRPYLETKYGIRFAPNDVAEKFAFEGYMQPAKFLSDQFGVHGTNPRRIMRTDNGDRFVINQFRGLGDILFLVPLIRFLQDEGHSVLWPIADEFFDIAKHFPDIQFVPKSAYDDIPYDEQQVVMTKYGKLLPYRFAGTSMHDCMRAKYELYDKPLDIWRNLKWKRDYEHEARLAKFLRLPEKYILVNNNFCQPELGMTAAIRPKTKLPIIEMQMLPGFSMLDWTIIIENAAEIHTVNTSILYILEVMKLTQPIHLYPRGIHGEVAFEHTDYLHTKPYIYH